MKRRIAIWTHGGVGTGLNSQGQPCIQRLVTRLADQYIVDVYIHSPPNRDFSPEGFCLFSPKTRIELGVLRWVNLFFLFYRNHRKRKYDLFYAFWGYPAGLIVVLLAKIFRRPSVIHLQGGDAAYVPDLRYGAFTHPLRRKICVWTYSHCSALIALTEYQTQCLRRFGIKRMVQVIPYGVDTRIFTYRQNGVPGTPIRFLHVGNQTPIKDQDTLLHAFALIADRMPARLTFVGTDHNGARLAHLSDVRGIRDKVIFAGAVPYSELPGYYHESDVLLLTSLFEGQGLVITEAAACGTLLAGTPVGILADMGEHCGIIAPVREPEALAKKIIDVLQSPARVNEIKTAARTWASEKDEDFTLIRIVEQLNQCLESAE